MTARSPAGTTLQNGPGGGSRCWKGGPESRRERRQPHRVRSETARVQPTRRRPRRPRPRQPKDRLIRLESVIVRTIHARVDVTQRGPAPADLALVFRNNASKNTRTRSEPSLLVVSLSLSLSLSLSAVCGLTSLVASPAYPPAARDTKLSLPSSAEISPSSRTTSTLTSLYSRR